MTGLDSQYLVVLCPKLLQALLTALGEAALCRAVRWYLPNELLSRHLCNVVDPVR